MSIIESRLVEAKDLINENGRILISLLISKKIPYISGRATPALSVNPASLSFLPLYYLNYAGGVLPDSYGTDSR